MATDIQLHKQQAQELSNKLWAIALSSEIEEFVKEQYEKFRAEGV